MTSEPAETVLLLYPWPELGRYVIRSFLDSKCRIVVFAANEEDASHCRVDTDLAADRLMILNPAETEQALRRDRSALYDAGVFNSRVVIDFLGHDVPRWDTEGEGDEWRIPAEGPAHRRLAVVNAFLKIFNPQHGCVWINLVYGLTTTTEDDARMCPTRYSITGYTEALRSNPTLNPISIINLCLGYHRRPDMASRIVRCIECLSDKYSQDAIDVTSDENIARFLASEAFRLLESGK